MSAAELARWAEGFRRADSVLRLQSEQDYRRSAKDSEICPIALICHLSRTNRQLFHTIIAQLSG